MQLNLVPIKDKFVVIEVRQGCNLFEEIIESRGVNNMEMAEIVFKEIDFFRHKKLERIKDLVNDPYPTQHLLECNITIAARQEILFLLRLKGWKI